MLALYRSGARPEALEAYRDAAGGARRARDRAGRDAATARAADPRRRTPRSTCPASGCSRTAAFRLPGPLVPASPFPFVGRAHELATLRRAARASRGRRGRGSCCSPARRAPARRGSSRELAHEAAARGVLVLYGASDAAVSMPYQPLREWLEFLLRVCDPDALAECLGATAKAGAARPRARASDRHRSSGSGGSRGRPLPRSRVPPRRLLTKMARVQPLLLVADDLHWADSETLHLLRRLARTAPEARMLVVAAFRDPGEAIAPALADTLADVSRLDAVTRAPTRKSRRLRRGRIHPPLDGRGCKRRARRRRSASSPTAPRSSYVSSGATFARTMPSRCLAACDCRFRFPNCAVRAASGTSSASAFLGLLPRHGRSSSLLLSPERDAKR